jgi:hypothetical protein
MRLKTEIWVKAYLRVRSADSVSAMVVRHGDDDAGAVFIKVATLDGRAMLYGPAPSGFEPTGADRRWVPHLSTPTLSTKPITILISGLLRLKIVPVGIFSMIG